MTAKNVLMVWDRMGDYHRARVRETRKVLTDRKVFTADLTGADSLYRWAATSDPLHLQLSSKPLSRFDFGRIAYFIEFIRKNNVGYLCIAGYGRLEYVFFLIYGKLTGLTVLLFAESWYPSSKLFDRIKSLFLKSTCDAFLVSGRRALDHFTQRLGISRAKVRIGYSVVDNSHFYRRDAPHENKTVLCIARFAPEKNLETLINAFTSSKLSISGWHLVIVGGGPLKGHLQELSSAHPIKLLEWQSYDDLPKLYHEASLFVLPSVFEPWGLVVNEGMAAGLPIVVSDQVGSLPDLVNDLKNGWSFPPGDVNALTRIFNGVEGLSNSELNAMGAQSLTIIEKYSVELFATNLKALLLRES